MAVYNISINQGESYNLDATLVSSSGTSVNLSGYYLRGQARYSYGSTGVLLDLSPTITNATGGAINLTLTPAQTARNPQTTYQPYPAGHPVPTTLAAPLAQAWGTVASAFPQQGFTWGGKKTRRGRKAKKTRKHRNRK